MLFYDFGVAQPAISENVRRARRVAAGGRVRVAAGGGEAAVRRARPLGRTSRRPLRPALAPRPGRAHPRRPRGGPAGIGGGTAAPEGALRLLLQTGRRGAAHGGVPLRRRRTLGLGAPRVRQAPPPRLLGAGAPAPGLWRVPTGQQGRHQGRRPGLLQGRGPSTGRGCAQGSVAARGAQSFNGAGPHGPPAVGLRNPRPLGRVGRPGALTGWAGPRGVVQHCFPLDHFWGPCQFPLEDPFLEAHCPRGDVEAGVLRRSQPTGPPDSARARG